MNEPQQSPQPATRPIVVADIGQMSDDEIEVFTDVFIQAMIDEAG